MNEEIVKHDISMIKEYIKTNDETTIIKTLLMIDYLEKYMEQNKQLKQQLKDIEEYLESIKDMPDADMYIKLGEYKEFKHILNLIHKGSE